ncbi:unnamed protein product [Pleuronectes platessa]|uniref:Uncharacterized protein n=1 Tax=Pleuronectes platessa TaxID=8262 RepID=A0A9N7V6S2_PLEPL|nr:unnamed protein product [Pleuronectes platessa]
MVGRMMDNSSFKALLSTTTCTPFNHHFKKFRLAASDGASLLNQLLKSVGVTSSDSASPADHSKAQCIGYNRLPHIIQESLHYLSFSSECPLLSVYCLDFVVSLTPPPPSSSFFSLLIRLFLVALYDCLAVIRYLLRQPQQIKASAVSHHSSRLTCTMLV